MGKSGQAAITDIDPELFNAQWNKSQEMLLDFDNDGDDDVVLLKCYNKYCFGDPSAQYYAERHARLRLRPGRR